MKKHLSKILCLIPTAFISSSVVPSVVSCNQDNNIDAIIIDGYSVMHMYDTQTFLAIIKPQDEITKNVQWDVINGSGEGHIDTNTGKFTAISIGTVTIKAVWKSNNEIFGEKTIEIIEPSPTSVIIDGPNETNVGEDTPYSAVVGPDQSVQSVNWLISPEDQKIATIDEEGHLHPKYTGNIKIYAQSTYDPSIIGYKEITINEPIVEDFETDPWESIIYLVQSGGYDALYNAYKDTESYMRNNSFVGLVRKLPITMNGETLNHDIVVIGEKHDDLADGSGKAALTFEFKNLLWDGNKGSTSGRLPLSIWWNPPIHYGNKLNFWYLNEHLYCDLRLQLMTTIRDLIDQGLGVTRETSPIKTVVKKTNAGGDTVDSSHNLISSDETVFVLSLSEVYSAQGINKLDRDDIEGLKEVWQNYSFEGDRYKYWENRIGDDSPDQLYHNKDEGTNAFAPESNYTMKAFWFRSPRILSEDTDQQKSWYKFNFVHYTILSNVGLPFDTISIDSPTPTKIGVLPCFCI